jgi:hypothetical protein
MARKKPADLVHVNLRLREDLRQQLEDAAKERGVTLSTEIRMRLDDSFKREAQRGFEDILVDMQSSWASFSNRLLRLSFEKDLVEEITRAENLDAIKLLARFWLSHGSPENEWLKPSRPRGGV